MPKRTELPEDLVKAGAHRHWVWNPTQYGKIRESARSALESGK